jgi:hypothetical protein
MILEVDKDEVPTYEKRRKTSNALLHDLLTREGVVKVDATD